MAAYATASSMAAMHKYQRVKIPLLTLHNNRTCSYCTRYKLTVNLLLGWPALAIAKAGPGGHSEGSEMGSYGERCACGVSSCVPKAADVADVALSDLIIEEAEQWMDMQLSLMS
jgi:hypothetical protein